MTVKAAKRLTGDRCVQIPATWGAYLQLDGARRDKSQPRCVYNKGRLTIVSKGLPHERTRVKLSMFVTLMFMELGVPARRVGSVTLKQRSSKRKGVEADATFYLSNLEHIKRCKELVMGVDPAPDLAIEIVVSHPVRDALRVYASFGVNEVWVCQETGLTFLALGEDGRYKSSAVSALLPIVSSAEMTPWVFADFPDDTTIALAFRDWVRATLAPRVRKGGE